MTVRFTLFRSATTELPVKSYGLVLMLFAFLANGCQDEETKAPSDSLNKIMPLGASRVEGNSPVFESYRYELWTDLVEGGYDIDFIGTMTDPVDYPQVSDMTFDPDHEGRGGWTSARILANIESWLDRNDVPDIVLFSSPGGNDILGGRGTIDEALANVNRIIDILQERNPNVTILIEELAPGMSRIMTPTLSALFERMQVEIPALTNQQTTATSRIIAVDMHTGFSDALLADDVHYNVAGAKFIAERYYEALQDVLVTQ